MTWSAPTPLPPPRLRAWAEIDVGALERNLRWISVVKADAYGHGLAAIATRLMRGGAELFAVANLAEAASLLEVGRGWPVLVLGPLLPEEAPEAVALRVIPSLSSLAEATALSRAAVAAGRPCLCHLKVDTGMGRAGVWHEEAPPLWADLRRLPGLQVRGLFTHFSSADTHPDETATQRARFLSLVQRLGIAPSDDFLLHADNSAGLASFPVDGPLNGVRLGLLQFGIHPSRESAIGQVLVEPVLSLHARVSLVKRLPAGMGISYGRSHILRRDSTLAVLTAGYADGIPTALSNVGQVLIHGRRCPILGRVTMDQTVVDVSDLDPAPVPGDIATFIGAQGEARLHVDEVATLAQRIPYEIFCGLSRRVTRVYRTDSAS